MTLNEAFEIVISFLISEAKNEEYIKKLNIILNGIKDKKHIEQERHPKFMSILLFGHNIFPYKNENYIQMAEYIKGKPA